MTNAEAEQLKAQMNVTDIDMSGAQAESPEDQAARVKRELPLFAQAYPKIELIDGGVINTWTISTGKDFKVTLPIDGWDEPPKKKWWQWWRK